MVGPRSSLIEMSWVEVVLRQMSLSLHVVEEMFSRTLTLSHIAMPYAIAQFASPKSM